MEDKKRSEYGIKYRGANSEKIKACRKRYYQTHKEYFLAKNAEYRQRNRKKVNEKNAKWRRENPEKMKGYLNKHYKTPKGRYTALKSRAVGRQVPFTITREEFCGWFVNQPLKCHYCSVALINNGGLKQPNTLTIDRKDNGRGYSLENMAFCCSRCNMIKGAWFTEKQMLEIMPAILKVLRK